MGMIPYQAIRTMGEEGCEALIEVANVDVANTYRILIQHLVGKNAVRLSRIGMDFLRFESDLEEVILQDRFAQVVHGYEEDGKILRPLKKLKQRNKLYQHITESSVRTRKLT